MFDDTSPLVNFPRQPRIAPIHELNHEHDQTPLWHHSNGRVPGTRRPSSVEARRIRAEAELLLQQEMRAHDAALDGWLPGVDDVADWQREGLDR